MKTKKPVLKYYKLTPEAKDPVKSNPSDCGYDLFNLKKVTINGHSKEKVNTGIAFEIPEGYRIEIKERSSIGSTTPLRVCAGIIDQNYRGEIIIVLENTSPYRFVIDPGTKIAQAVLYHNISSDLEEIKELSLNTDRNTKGFGSSNE